MEEYELGSDVEPDRAQQATLKLTSRPGGSRRGAAAQPAPHHGGLSPPTPRTHTPRRRSRDETKKEIQEDDEATLRELLIRYLIVARG